VISVFVPQRCHAMPLATLKRLPSTKPTAEQLANARNLLLPDVIAPHLKVLFVGVNPGLYSAAIGHQFGRPGNRFWPTLFHAGFTERLLDPREDQLLLSYGLGITNLCARTTARADELTLQELHEGARALVHKVEMFAPQVVAILGVTAYRSAFAQPKGQLGESTQSIANAKLWVLPNPSGLNAHHQLPDLTRLFGALRGSVA
jgi:double-stranded uracil-DNA glycosylase